MDLYFLGADVPLTKTYDSFTESWSNYPRVRDFTAHKTQVNSLQDFKTELSRHASQGHCLLKANQIHKPIENCPRAGSTHTDDATRFLVLDVDGVDLSAPSLLSMLGLSNMSHIVQFSSGYGIKDNLRCHIFIMLDSYVPAPQIKKWVKTKNLELSTLRKAVTLAAGGVSLRWPLDVTVNQNDKLIYIAPPKLLGIEDPLQGQRIYLEPREQELLSASIFSSIEDPTSAEQALINELRKASGKYAKEPRFETKQHLQVCINPDEAQVTGIKQGDHFTYINLNGGDSWGYYHHTLEPRLLFNFKGEPTYKLATICPEYAREARDTAKHLKETARERMSHEASQLQAAARLPASSVLSPAEDADSQSLERQPLYFLESHTNERYVGWYYPTLNEVELYRKKSKGTATEWFITNRLLEPGGTPPAFHDMELVFDPAKPALNMTVEPPQVNAYRPSCFMKSSMKIENCPIPQAFDTLISHLTVDAETKSRFLNWLAWIWQNKRQSGAAWLLQGTQGTGKGLLVSEVLIPLYGGALVERINTSAVSSQFNGWLERSLFIVVEEADVEHTQNPKFVASKLKSYIADNPQQINAKNMPEMSRYILGNFILNTNTHSGALIEPNDRRYNVAPRQQVPLRAVVGDIEIFLHRLQSELQGIANFFESYAVDASILRVPFENEARRDVIDATTDSAEEVVDRLFNGDFEFLVAGTPTKDDDVEYRLQAAYLRIIRKIASGVIHNGGTVKLAREELMDIFSVHVNPKIGRMGKTKFSNYMRRLGMILVKIRVGEKTYKGLTFSFAMSPELEERWRRKLSEVNNVESISA